MNKQNEDIAFQENTLSALIIDPDTQRAGQLAIALKKVSIRSTLPGKLPAASSTSADFVFIAADFATDNYLADMLDYYGQMLVDSRIILHTAQPVRKLQTDIIRERAWMEIPKINGHSNLLQRYTNARQVTPLMIVDDNPDLYRSFQSGMDSSLNFLFTPSTAHTLDEAFQKITAGEVPVFLSTPRQLPDKIDTTILVYKFCPATVAVLIEMAVQSSPEEILITSPQSRRFGILKIHSSIEHSIRIFASRLDTDGSIVIPCSVSPPTGL